MPVKLLDFDPDVNLDPSQQMWSLVENAFKEDIVYGFTPDRAKIRYAGPQTVFIWDQLKNVNKFENATGHRQDSGWRVVHYDIRTKNKYLPFRDQNETLFKYHVPLSPKWRTGFDDDIMGSLAIGRAEPLPIQGRLIKVNLSCLDALDRHYLNTSMTQRIRIPVISRHAPDKEQWVWAYLGMLKSFSRWKAHENTYFFDDTVDARPVPVVMSGQDKTYEVNACHG